jgi:SRSO17 transposase
MTPGQLAKLDKQLSLYLDYLTDDMGRPERRRALALYMMGLLLDGERKTVVSMAGRLVDDEGEIEAMRQRLQQCVVVSGWADEEIRRRLALRLEQEIRPDAYVLDDTGFPKKGKYSVGVSRQYSGTLGRVDNCQVAPSLHVASDEGSGCIGMRLYLPEEWASDIKRRRLAGVPEEVVFKRKWELALDLLDEALAAGLPRRVVLADAGYGDSTEFRDGLTERGCNYVVGVSGIRLVWPPGSNPRPPKKPAGAGRPPSQHRDGNRKPKSLTEMAETLEYRKYNCPDGKGGTKEGYFAFARVRSAERRTKGRPPSNELWLISEWRPGNNERKFYFSDLPATVTRRELVRLVKLRWRVERDYQELKAEVGLDHFEGRTWRGFHHHVTLCAAAHGFLAIQRRLFPPEDLPMDPTHGAPPNPDNPHRTSRSLSAVSSGF